MTKKIGYFFFSFLPLLLVLVLEFGATFFMMGISLITAFLFHANDFTEVFSVFANTVSSIGFNSYVMVIYALLAIAIYGIWYYLQFYATYLPKAKETFHPLMIVGILFLVPGTQYLCSYLITGISILFPSWLTAYEELLESAGMDDTLTFGLLLYSVILAPICEELMCRGVTMSSAKRALPFWAANILQAFIFGLLHMNWLQGTYAFCLGLVLGYICEKSGTIYCSILLHMLFNFWGTSLEASIPYGNTTLAYIFWFFFGIVATVMGILFFNLGIKKRNQKVLLSSQQIS